MSDTYNYEVLEPGGHARLVGNVLDRISRASANTASAVGSSRAMLGDPETASWMERTTAADGAALIESVKGNTLVWNQLFNAAPTATTSNGVTFTIEDGSIVANGTATGLAIRNTTGQLTTNHKYLYKGCPSGGSLSTYYAYINGPDSGFIQRDTGAGVLFTAPSSGATNMIVAVVSGNTISNLKFNMQLFDLTAMFGAGNEPATVDEFEALYPEPYYPYDPGSLLPVRMEGIETVGFNQWDEEWEVGSLTDGVPTIADNAIRSKNFCECLPSTSYYLRTPKTDGGSQNRYYLAITFYDADKQFVRREWGNNQTVTSPDNAAYFKIVTNISTVVYGPVYLNDICINISDTSRNGTYEPHWSSQRTIPATDLRSAGTAYDEQTATERITRVGAVDLGTLSWEKYDLSGTAMFRSYSITNIKPAVAAWTAANVLSAQYPTYGSEGVASHDKGVAVSQGAHIIYLRDSSFDSLTANEAKTALSGVYLFYELATSTTTPIDPPLPLSYRVGAGGIERVMVAEDTTSAPPIFATRYPLDPADLAASIAPVDGPTAKTNHQVGDLIMLGFTLCKATQVIVTGETIAIGTNVTRTSVAAELAALSE